MGDETSEFAHSNANSILQKKKFEGRVGVQGNHSRENEIHNYQKFFAGFHLIAQSA